MNICIPVDQDAGLESPVCAHFGSAPFFMIVETESGSCRAVSNTNQHHAHGRCVPLQSLRGQDIDGVVVGGIGRGALNKLRAAGIDVYMADKPTVGETIEAFKAGQLGRVNPEMACAHHGHGH